MRPRQPAYNAGRGAGATTQVMGTLAHGARFDDATRRALLDAGWHVAEVDSGASLRDLYAAGAPLKTDRLLREHADLAAGSRVPCAEVAYLDDLVPASLNQTGASGAALLGAMGDRAPLDALGLVPALGSAALYLSLLVAHHRRRGVWLLARRYTWTADAAAGRPVAIGAFGAQRPILLSTVPEPTGRGIGVLPLIIPPWRRSRA